MIPVGVTDIGEGAFDGCYSLQGVTIPGTVTNIGEDAFYCCFGLTRIAIPGSVRSVGDEAFVGCDNLTNVILAGSVTNWGGFEFAFCTNVTSVYFSGAAPNDEDESSMFWGVMNATVYYLPGTTGWGNTFSNAPFLPAVLWNPLIQTGEGSFGVQSNRFGFNITGTANIPIMVEACTNLASPVWTPLQTFTLTNGSFYFSDPQWTNYPGRYYRISSP